MEIVPSTLPLVGMNRYGYLIFIPSSNFHVAFDLSIEFSQV